VTISNVFSNCDKAVAGVFDNTIVMIGGFGSFGGLPVNLVEALARQGVSNLTIIANMGGVGFKLSHRIKPGRMPGHRYIVRE
jgi:3-oxoadipate CoA-transferase alpha subunit